MGEHDVSQGERKSFPLGIMGLENFPPVVLGTVGSGGGAKHSPL